MPDVSITVEPELTIDGNPLRVLRAIIHERLDEVGYLEVDATGSDVETAIPEPKDVIGTPGELSLKLSDGSGSRIYHGIVVEADHFDMEHGHNALRLRVVPKLWKLGKRRDCRTFQDKSVVEIVKKVLNDGGVTDQEWNTTGTFPKRVYTVQYRETDLEFVLRLLAEEGIYFSVRHADGKDTVAFGDDPTGLGDVSGNTTLSFKHVHGHEEAGEHVTHLRKTHRVRSDKVYTRDYDFEKPKLKVESTKEGTEDGAHVLEVYQYPGRFLEKGLGDRYAQTLLDSMQVERDVVEGQTGVLYLEPGYRFTVDNAPYAPLNSDYLITGIDLELHAQRHAGDEKPGIKHALKGALPHEKGHKYVCRFTAVPKTNAYRPPRRTVERVVPELQTAWSTGPSGEEIYVDKHVRVKTQFHWDRLGKMDENTSPWIRTVQLPTGGAVYVPRMNWEVAVRYVEGDVDRPVVFGRLYNGVNQPPYALPEGKARGSIQTATTPGGGSTNEFRMDDTKGKEEMFFNASKDMSIKVNNNTTEAVGNNCTHKIGSNHKLHVTNSVTSSVGAAQKTTVGASQKLSVQQPYFDDVGSHTKTVGAARKMKVGGDHKKEVATSCTTTVGAIMTDLVIGSVSESTPASITHTVGAALVEITTNSRAVVVGGMKTESSGAAKVIISKGGVGVQVGGMMSETVGGAIVTSIKGNREDNATATFTEVAAGAHIVKAENITFEAEGLLSLTMGASTITLTPASISIAGVSAKLDGATAETAAMILDN